MNNTQLIFVYNANSDLFSTVTDFAHKILSPSTYECKLCALTYDSLSIKQEWKSFIKNLPVQTVFLHKNEFEKQYQTRTALPAAYILSSGVIKEIINNQEIKRCNSVDELKDLVNSKLQTNVQHHNPNL